MSSTAKKGSRDGDLGHKSGKLAASSTQPASKDPSSQSIVKKVTVEGKVENPKSSEQPNPKVLQPTAEQLRLAQMISDIKREDPDMPRKIEKLVELTNCTVERACITLHDMDNDLDRAISHLLDNEIEGDWEVSGKKRRSRQVQQQSASEDPSANKSGASRGRDGNRDRSRSSRGGPPRLRGRGRGKDKENSEEAGEVFGDSSRGRGSSRGRMSNGPGRDRPGGGRGGFGRGGRGRRGPGGATPAVDNWDADLALSEGVANMKVDSWTDDFPSADDWDNEEYVGSLVETKVFTPSQPQQHPVAEPSPLINGSSAPGASTADTQAAAGGISYSAVASSILQQQQQQQQQQPDMSTILQQAAASATTQQQMYLAYQQASADALKAMVGKPQGQAAPVTVGSSAQQAQKPRTLKAKVPPPSKIPSSAVEMPDDSLVSGLDVKFGTLDFGVESSGLELSPGVDLTSQSATSASSGVSVVPESMASKLEQYSNVTPQAPAPSSLPKPDASLGGFSSAVSSAAPLSAAAKPASSAGTYPGYGSSYPAPPGMSSSAISSSTQQQQQPGGTYASSTQSAAYSQQQPQGVSSSYQGAVSQSYGAPSYSTIYNSSTAAAGNKLGTSGSNLSDPSASLRVDINSSAAAAPSSTSRPAATSATATAASHAAKVNAATGLTPANSTGMPSLPPGVPMLGPGFIMGQGPALPYYAPTAAGLQQHQVYSLEDLQYRFPQMTGFYDVNYQSPTSLGTGRDASLTSLGYPGPADAKFQRNDNNSPVPTSLSQSAVQTHGAPFINAAAAAPIPPAYAYYYGSGVMPGGFQFSAPLYPVSAAASGHVVSAASSQYGKAGPSTAGGVTSAQTTPSVGGAGPNSATGPPSYGGYGSPYDDFSKVYGTVGVGNAVQGAKIGGVGAGVGPSAVGGAPSSVDLGVGAAYGKAHNQLGKINSYDKAPSFHTATPPPYGPTGGVGGLSPYTAQHMFIQTLAPHSHSLMHPQLHQDSVTGPGQRSQSGSQQNKAGSKSSYTGSYWSSS